MSRPMVDISKRNRDRILPSLRYNLIFKILEHFLLHNFDRDQTLTEITKNFFTTELENNKFSSDNWLWTYSVKISRKMIIDGLS